MSRSSARAPDARIVRKRAFGDGTLAVDMTRFVIH